MTRCKVADCARSVRCKDLCGVHYERSRTGGSLDAPVRWHAAGSLAQRLAARLTPTSGGCLEFVGSTCKGYGRISVDGVPRFAHRVAWRLANGPISEGLMVLHACDNRPCCNVKHLFLGTAADNTADMLSKGRHASQRATHCVNGHRLVDENIRIREYGGYVVRRCRACLRHSESRRRR